MIDLDNINDDGRLNEQDNVRSSVERVIGGSGNDVLIGSAIANTLEGRAGIDSIFGRAGNDTILGGADGDFLFGELGDDDISGQSGGDDLFGGNGEDTLRGDGGDDVLHGDDGNDRLLGGGGEDELFGDDGIDSLFGSDGLDDLTGGADSDRFLDSYSMVLGVRVWSDNHLDKVSDDVRIGFNDGTTEKNVFDSIFAVGSWTDADVEAIDVGLKVLHEATSNKNLLQRAPNTIFSGNLVTITRQGAPNDASTVLAWNAGRGRIFVADATFNDSRSPAEVIIHEMAHNWDDEFDPANWSPLSGWVLSLPSPGPTFVQADSYDGPLGAMFYWYDSTLEGFVSDYAKSNPLEDLAESFANYFMNLGGLSFVGDSGGADISSLPGKTAFLDGLLAAAM